MTTVDHEMYAPYTGHSGESDKQRAIRAETKLQIAESRITDLEAQLAEARRDAERYKHIKAAFSIGWSIDGKTIHVLIPDGGSTADYPDIDQAIDAAMQERE